MKGRKTSAVERRVKLEEDATERRKVFKELCDHVEKGFSLQCFPPLSEVSIRKYLKTYVEEFIEEELHEALRKGQIYWEGIGRRQSDGSCLGNSRSWYYNMVNRFGWREKVDVTAEHKGQVSVNVISYASQQASKDAVEDE